MINIDHHKSKIDECYTCKFRIIWISSHLYDIRIGSNKIWKFSKLSNRPKMAEPPLPKIKCFQLVQKNFAILDITPELAMQPHPFNSRRISIGFLALGLIIICALKFFFYEAQTFAEYTQSSYASFFMITITFNLSVVTLKVKKVFKLMDDIEDLVNTCVYLVENRIHCELSCLAFWLIHRAANFSARKEIIFEMGNNSIENSMNNNRISNGIGSQSNWSPINFFSALLLPGFQQWWAGKIWLLYSSSITLLNILLRWLFEMSHDNRLTAEAHRHCVCDAENGQRIRSISTWWQ